MTPQEQQLLESSTKALESAAAATQVLSTLNLVVVAIWGVVFGLVSGVVLDGIYAHKATLKAVQKDIFAAIDKQMEEQGMFYVIGRDRKKPAIRHDHDSLMVWKRIPSLEAARSVEAGEFDGYIVTTPRQS